MKLAQQLAALWQPPLFNVFLDLRKAYDALDRGRYLEILLSCGVSTSVVGILEVYSSHQQVVPKAGGGGT